MGNGASWNWLTEPMDEIITTPLCPPNMAYFINPNYLTYEPLEPWIMTPMEFASNLIDDMHDDIDSDDPLVNYHHYKDGGSVIVIAEYESGVRLKVTVEEL